MKNIHKIGFLTAMLLLTGPALADDTHHQDDVDQGTQQQLTMMGGAMMGNAMMGNTMAGQAGPGSGMMSMMMPMLQMMSPRHIEGRLAFLRTELKINDGQEAVWTAFADAVRNSVRESPHAMPGIGDMMMGAKAAPDLLQRMSGREQALSEELARLQKLEAVTKPLYAALSDDQKKAANELLMPALFGHM